MDRNNQNWNGFTGVKASVVAGIFARGGSQGIPRKALRKVGGLSLLERAVGDALSCSQIEAVFVSTDDEEFAAHAKSAGAEVPFLRPAHLASHTAAEIDSWRHLIEFLDANGEEVTTLVSVPPTAPLRLPKDIEAAINRFVATGADIVVTGHESRRNPTFNMVTVDEGGRAHLAAHSDVPVVRRQDAPPLWDLTTVAYVAKSEYVLSAPSLFSGHVALSVVPAQRALDIDDEFDLYVADLLLRELGR